jgi:hypothetical protein
MPDSALILRRANGSRKGGPWQHDDYDVFDGERDVGRIFQQADRSWFWGVSFMITKRKSYGRNVARGSQGGVPGRVRGMEGNTEKRHRLNQRAGSSR